MTEFAPAVRANTAIVLALAGASGSGKTKSALELAVGLAGEGQIALIDTEGRRALHYADEYRFLHAEWRPPFTPEALADLLKKAHELASVVIVDSMSDEMEGEGGLQEMADAEFDEQVKKGWEPNRAAAWARPKARHKKQIIEWIRHEARCHLIFCVRAEEKVKFEKVADRGKSKTVVVPIGWQPICEKRLPYEMSSSFLFTPDRPGIPKPIKLYDKHAPFFPPDRQVSREAGVRLAAWAAGGAAIQSSEIKNADYPARIEAGTRLAERASGAAPLRAVEVDALSDASPLGETDALRADLNATAEGKAEEGSAEFRLWWRELPGRERALIRGFLSRYRGIAQEADEAEV